MDAASEVRDRPRGARSPSPLALIALGVVTASLVGVAAGVALHFSLGSRHASRAPVLPPFEGQAVWAQGQVAAPNFALRDQRGQLVSLAAQRGRTVVLAFMDSRCHQVCPLEGRVLAQAIAGLPRRDRPALLVVSVDPWADTSASALAAARYWGFSGSWHWLFGTRPALAKVWRSYRIYVKRTTGDIVHSDAVYVIDRRGFERVGFLFPFLPGPIQRDLVRLTRGSRA